MNEYIDILVNESNTITYKSELPTIYQGSANDIYLNIEIAKELPENSVVELLFRRSDGNVTPWLPAELINGTYQFKMRGGWYAAKAGRLTYTIKVKKVINNDVSKELLTSYDGLSILPNPDALFVPAPLKPSNYDIITSRLVTAENLVNEVKDANLVKEIYTGELLPDDKTSIKYKTFDDNEHTVEIELPHGLATEEEVDNAIKNKFINVNPVTKIEPSNNDLEFVVKQYGGSNKTIKIKANGLVTEDEYEERIGELTEDLVAYDTLDSSPTPSVTVYLADRAISDEDGNNIKETYVPVSGGTTLDPINVESFLSLENNLELKTIEFKPDGEYSGQVVPTVGVGNISPYGRLQIYGHSSNGNVGFITINPVDAEFEYYDSELRDTTSMLLKNIATINKTNTFEQPQAIAQQLDLINVNGSRCSIKNVNSNFLISYNGSNLLNIDTGLNKVTFFNKEVVFDEDLVEVESNLNADLNTIANKIVYVECQISGDTYRLTPNSYNSIIIGSGGYLHAVTLDVTTSNVTLVSSNPINGGSQYTPTIENIRPIKVGEL